MLRPAVCVLLWSVSVLAFPNQAGSCDGVGGTHLHHGAANSLADLGCLVTANGILLPERRTGDSTTLVTIPTTRHGAVHVTLRTAAPGTGAFKGALLRFANTTDHGFISAATHNARELDFCNDHTIVAISHNHPRPKTELGALLTVQSSTTQYMTLRVVVVPYHNATVSSYATAEWNLRIVANAVVEDYSDNKNLQYTSVAVAEHAESTDCPNLCGDGNRLSQDSSAIVRWRGEDLQQGRLFQHEWVTCKDLPRLAGETQFSCRNARELAKDHRCCVASSACLPPTCVLWPDGQVPDGTRCGDLREETVWSALVADRGGSCRISRLLVGVHCGGECEKSAAVTSTAAGLHASLWTMLLVGYLSVSS